LDILTVILIIGGVLSAICLVGMIRNWNKESPGSITGGPLLHFTWVGWVLALIAVSAGIGLIIFAWQVGWVPPRRMRLVVMGLAVVGVIAGLLTFFILAAILNQLGLRAWHSSNPNNDGVAPKSKPKQLRYRLDQNPSKDRNRPDDEVHAKQPPTPLDKQPPS